MLPHLGIVTGSIKLKTAIVAATLLFSSTNGISSLDIPPLPVVPSPVAVEVALKPVLDVSSNDALWQYLRAGLNYVEASGREMPIDFIHPGGVAFGPLALTRIAVKDVILHYDTFSSYTIDKVLADDILYEQCARAYADLLLWHYLKVRDGTISREGVFEILQQAWFLGPGIYMRGGRIPRSREKNAAEFTRRFFKDWERIAD